MSRLNLFNEPVSNKGQILGCTSCPLNNVEGVRKIKGLVRIRGRRAMLWAQSPGSKENAQGRELVGPAGELLWHALDAHGIRREDVDIQNVLRCRPLSEDGTEHEPTKAELLSCSVYNEEAIELNRNRARVHIVLGDVAGNQLLGNAFRKDRPIFWHAPWDAYVLLNSHPSFILRMGGRSAGYEYDVWKRRFAGIPAILEYPGRYGYLRAQNYQQVSTLKEFGSMEAAIRAEARTRRISFDIEDDIIDGRRVILLAGFGIGRFTVKGDYTSWQGRSWSVVLDHPEAHHEPGVLAKLKQRVIALIEDSSVRKVLQNGSYDVKRCHETLGARLRGYDYDTQYGTYLAYSFLRSCRLEDLTYLFFPEFADYKDIVEPFDKQGFSKVPLDRLILRNCGDCDVTKRLEERFSPEVVQPLVKVYIHAGKTLDAMESRGPILDWENWKIAEDVVPKMMAKLDRMLKRISGNPDFDIDKPLDVASLIYDTLALPVQEGCGRSTNKAVLEMLQAITGNKTIGLIRARRGLGKIRSTYLNSYANSARHHDDELHTRWALTGAVTGRLRSTGSDDNGVNLQNLHGLKLIQNLLVSDKRWRRAKTQAAESISDLEVLLAADGAQIEIRALAELSGDPLIIKFLQEGAKDRKNKLKDFHCLNGNMLTGFPVERIRDEKPLRKAIKNLIFGIVFGKAEDGIYDYIVQKMREADGPDVDLTGVTRKRAKQMHRTFFRVYKGVKRFIERMRYNAEHDHFVTTLFGFKRHIRENDESRKSFSGNQAINSPVQGTAHQFVLIAMALLDLKPKTYCHLQKCIMEVHDQLVFRVKVRYLAEAHAQLMSLFEHGASEYAEREFGLKLQVPILAEAEAGFCMGSMVPYEGETVEAFLTEWRKKQQEIESSSWETLMPVTGV